jgi:hypothetical protein
MYIRIEFHDIDSVKTKETQQIFFSSPNGMFLSSLNAHMISSNELRELFSNSVVFWYLDDNILNKYYCMKDLTKYPGVKCVNILPCEENYDNFIGNLDGLVTILMSYYDVEQK